MIEIDNHYGEFRAYLVSPDNEIIGAITNVISLDNVRRQIKKEQLSGYTIEIKDKIIKIDKNGNLSDYPEEFNVYCNVLLDLI